MKYWEIKKFMMDHKKEIIAGTVATVGAAALAVIGVKCHKPKLTSLTDSVDPYYLDLLDTVDRVSRQCTHYAETSPKAIWAMFDKDGNLIDHCIKDDDGDILCVDNIIAFGHKVKSEP